MTSIHLQLFCAQVTQRQPQFLYNIAITIHIKIEIILCKNTYTNFIQHISCFMAHTILSQKVKYFSWSAFQKSKYKDFSSKYFFITSTKSAHSIKICKIVVMLSNAAQTVGFSLKKKKRVLAAPLCDQNNDLLVDTRRGYLRQQMTLLQ